MACSRSSNSRDSGPASPKRGRSSPSPTLAPSLHSSLDRGFACARSGFPRRSFRSRFRDRDGTIIGRADFCWPRHRTLGEVDGNVKYASGDPKVLFDEKLREDALRGQGWELVRWTSGDVEGSFWAVERRLRAAFTRGDRCWG